MHSRRWFIAGLAIVLGTVAWSTAATAAPNQFAINVDGDGNALGGYDAVAYLADSRATRGDPAYTFAWKGARWLFTSATNLNLFAADPERYAPRIGGFCAVGAANGRMALVDPEMWLIIKGRLYLNINADVREAAKLDLEAGAAQAEANWNKVKPLK